MATSIFLLTPGKSYEATGRHFHLPAKRVERSESSEARLFQKIGQILPFEAEL